MAESKKRFNIKVSVLLYGGSCGAVQNPRETFFRRAISNRGNSFEGKCVLTSDIFSASLHFFFFALPLESIGILFDALP